MIQTIFSAIRGTILAITSALEALTFSLELLEKQIEIEENKADDRATDIINRQRKTIDELTERLHTSTAPAPKEYHYSIEKDKEMLNVIAYSVGYDWDRKIHAIKLIRELTGIGLKEAKDFVEASTPPASSFLNHPDFQWLLWLNLDGGANGVNTLKFIKMITKWDDDKIIKFMENSMSRFPNKIKDINNVPYKYVMTDDNNESMGEWPDDDDWDDDYNDESDTF